MTARRKERRKAVRIVTKILPGNSPGTVIRMTHMPAFNQACAEHSTGGGKWEALQSGAPGTKVQS